MTIRYDIKDFLKTQRPSGETGVLFFPSHCSYVRTFERISSGNSYLQNLVTFVQNTIYLHIE